MQAEPRTQLALLDIATLDQKIAQFRHEKKTLPVLAKLKELASQRAKIVEQFVAADTKVSDAQLALDRVLEDLEPAKQRLERNQKMANEGSVDARQLQNLLSESEHLTGRIQNLEDEQLEAEINLEDLQATRDDIAKQRTEIENEMRELITERDKENTRIDQEITTATDERAKLVEEIPDDLMKSYEKTATKNLTGAAKYDSGKCEGCRILLDPDQIKQIDSTPVNQIVKCPNCSRILVRA